MKVDKSTQMKIKSIFDTSPAKGVAYERLIRELNFTPDLARMTIAKSTHWAEKS